MRTIVVAGTCSGVGKTSIAVGLMAAYTRRGLRVQPFKIGPDFLDPIQHKAATGQTSYNLDGWMLSRDVNLACFKRRMADTDIAIVEGVMGLYDGRDGKSDVGSTAEMAKLLSAPVLLVLDCWALARSAAAMIRGYTSFDPAIKFAGVIFNKVGSPAHATWLAEAVLTTEPEIQILGGVPKTSGIELPERHLSLHMPYEEDLPVNYIEQLADLVELHVNLDAIWESAVICEPLDAIEMDKELALSGGPLSALPFSKHVRVGVARDSAFCFYYHANLLLLEEAGAELVYFSPLKDSLPPRLDALIFGGGYPELHLKQLTANKQMLYAIRAFALAGGIVYGECGGLMYLSQGIEGQDGENFKMCGVFPFWTHLQPVVHMGYVKVTPRDNCVLFPADIGEIRGQVYHFSEIYYPSDSGINHCPRGLTMKIEDDKSVEELEGYMQGNAMGSFVHLHFGSNPTVALAFVERCRTNTTKAAAVAAASASAVAGAGPVAAAAAGAAAASAVAAALGDHLQELVPLHSSVALTEFDSSSHKSRRQHATRTIRAAQEEASQTRIFERVNSFSPAAFSESMFEDWAPQGSRIRRCESFDLGQRSAESVVGDGNRTSGRLVRSESEFWGQAKEGQTTGRNVALNLGHHRDNSFSDYSNNVHYDTTSRAGFTIRRGNSGVLPHREGNHLSPREGNHSSPRSSISSSSSSSLCEGVRKVEIGAKPDVNSGPPTKEPQGAERLCNGQVSQNFKLDLSGHFKLSSRAGKPLNGRRLPERVVSLLPSATEILLEIGAGDRLIGITDQCDRPAGVRTGRHVVCWRKVDTWSKNVAVSIESLQESETTERNTEQLRALAAKKESSCQLDISWLNKLDPDLIISQGKCYQCDIHNNAAISMLTKEGVLRRDTTKLITLGPQVVTDVLDSIATIGEAVGLYAEACLLIGSLRSRLRQVAAAVASQSRPRMLLLQGFDPLLLGGHWVCEMETLAGGFDGLQKPGCYPEQLHWQRVIAYAPEVIVLAPRSSGLDQTLAEVEILGRQPGFWSIPAVERRQLYICEHSCFSVPGPRLVDGVELLAQILHPSVTRQLHIEETALKFCFPGGRCRPEELTNHFQPYQ